MGEALPLLVRSDPESNYRSNIIQDWAVARSIQWDLSPVEAQWGTGKVEATIDFVNTSATEMAYCDAACSIPDLFTWASRTLERAQVGPCSTTFGQFPGRRPRAAGTGNDAGFSNRAQHAKKDIRSTIVRSGSSRWTVAIGSSSQEQGSAAARVWGNVVSIWHEPGKRDSKVSKRGIIGPTVLLSRQRGSCATSALLFTEIA